MQILSKTNSFRGVYSALPTPFQESGALDVPALEKLIESQIAAGIHGIIPSGTTGESPTLDEGEKLKLFELSVLKCKQAGKGTLVIAGTGSNNTKKSIELTKKAAGIGVDACLVVTPYYNKPSAAGLENHFVKIADAAAKTPIILYNVPGRTGISMTPKTVAALSQHPNICGIKEASGSIPLFLEMKSAVSALKLNKPFYFLTGDDPTYWPFLAAGGDGVISVASNILPRCMRMIFEDWEEGRVGAGLALFQKIFALTENLFIEANPVPLKTLLAWKGVLHSKVREPLAPLTPDNELKLKKVWESLLPHIQNDRPREDLHV